LTGHSKDILTEFKDAIQETLYSGIMTMVKFGK
jgi:hypothetical protein